LIALAVLSFLFGVIFAVAQGALENVSWKKLEDRVKSEKAAHALREWLDRIGYDHLILTFEWSRLVLFLGFLTLTDHLLLRTLVEPWILGFALTVVFILLVGEAIPRFVARYNAERMMLELSPFVKAVVVVLAPVNRVMMWLPHAVARLSGKHPAAFEQERAAAELTDAAEEGERSGVLEEGEREMIENIIDLGDTEVVEVMTPRIDLVSIDSHTSIADARRVAVESGHSRLPVHEGNRDQIVGILHVKDLLKDPQNGDQHVVRELMRKALFIPETKALGELLREFRELKTHIAIVLDEYGGTSGIVTMEDILEEIVGEITDEFDEGETDGAIRRVDPQTVRVDAKVHVHELNEEFDLHLPDDAGYETLGGFVFSTLGRVPDEGETFQHNGAEFRILKADPRRVNRVQITVKAPGEAE
jgi:CBS domain containing-hemolysin-like protein